jgi:hypothetical protein
MIVQAWKVGNKAVPNTEPRLVAKSVSSPKKALRLQPLLPPPVKI